MEEAKEHRACVVISRRVKQISELSTKMEDCEILNIAESPRDLLRIWGEDFMRVGLQTLSKAVEHACGCVTEKIGRGTYCWLQPTTEAPWPVGLHMF